MHDMYRDINMYGDKQIWHPTQLLFGEWLK